MVGVAVRAARKSLQDDVPLLASALAYSAFLAVPAALLVVLGLFSLFAGPGTIASVMDRLGVVVPAQAVGLLHESLLRLERQPHAGIVVTIAGVALALWATTGAVTTAMTAINRAYERRDPRSFVARRLGALLVVVALGGAMLLLGAFLVLGPHFERWIGRSSHLETPVAWIWWSAQWPILIGSLLFGFATLFALSGHQRPEHRWRIVSPGAVVALVVWLAASGAFSVYAAHFGSYNKTWGALSGVIILLMWLWLLGLALLYGAEVDAELERTRRRTTPDVVSAPRREWSRAA